RTRVRAPAYPTRRLAGTPLPNPIQLRRWDPIVLEVHPHLRLERVADDEFLVGHPGIQGAVALMAIEPLDDVAHFDAEALGDLGIRPGETGVAQGSVHDGSRAVEGEPALYRKSRCNHGLEIG